MKISILFLCLLIVSCCDNNRSSSQKTDEQNTHQSANVKTVLGECVKLDTACKYISRFLGVSNLKRKASSLGIGGFIDIDYLKSPGTTTGNIKVINFFPCYTPASSNEPEKFWMSYRLSSVDTTTNCGCRLPVLCNKSKGEFLYTSDEIAQHDVKEYLIAQDDPIPIIFDDPSDFNVGAATRNFIVEYTDDFRNLLNRGICAYLTLEEVDSLINQKDTSGNNIDIAGIRYFLGLDPYHQLNKIRIIFIAVERNSNKNVLTIGNHDAVLWEKSWPPEKCD